MRVASVRVLTSTPPVDLSKKAASELAADTDGAATRTSAKPRAKPLNLKGLEDDADFLRRLEDAEARDSSRALSARSFTAECFSPSASLQCPQSVPPIGVLPLTVTVATESGRRRTVGTAADTPTPVERPASARMRSTPRPSPKPSTPRAPRAVRTPQSGVNEPAVGAIGFQGFNSALETPQKSARPKSARGKGKDSRC